MTIKFHVQTVFNAYPTKTTFFASFVLSEITGFKAQN